MVTTSSLLLGNRNSTFLKVYRKLAAATVHELAYPSRNIRSTSIRLAASTNYSSVKVVWYLAWCQTNKATSTELSTIIHISAITCWMLLKTKFSNHTFQIKPHSLIICLPQKDQEVRDCLILLVWLSGR